MPYPGTAVYNQFKDEGRLLYDGHWWNHPDYRYNHASFMPRLISPEQPGEATVQDTRLPLKEFYEEFYKLYRNSSSLINRICLLLNYSPQEIIKVIRMSNRIRNAYT
jgi:hypothetical protein